MKDYIIIVAAGSGARMKAATPKQFLELNGKPVLHHTIEKFYKYDPLFEIIVVLGQEYIQFWKDLIVTFNLTVPHRIVAGGNERFFSVKNALDTIESTGGIVGVHDAVRPLVSLRTIDACYNMARSHGNAIPAIHLNDSLRYVNAGVSNHVDRNNYRIIQTPQCFDLSLLKDAYKQPYEKEFTDDASVVEKFGERIHLVEGNCENIKITTSEELRMVAVLSAG